MSSPKSSEVGGANPQIEQASREIRELIAGRLSDGQVVSSRDQAIRQVVAAELLAATSDSDTEKQERARQLFIDYGYFDEVTRDLRDGETASERAAAAYILGKTGSRLATTFLIAALFDGEEDVRAAAAEALGKIDPNAANEAPHASADALLEPLLQQSVSFDEAVASGVILLDEDAVRKTLEDLEDRLLNVTTAWVEAERLALLRAQSEANFRAESSALRRQEAETRQNAEAAEARAESEYQKKLEAESESQQLAEELTRLQLEADSQGRALVELTQERAQIEAARRAEAEEARTQAEELYNSELARLRNEEEALRNSIEEAALRRAELERERRSNEEQAQRLLEEQTRLAAAEVERRAELESLRQHTEERNEAEEEQLLLEVKRLSQIAAEVSTRRAELEVAREKAETQARELADMQARIHAAEETHRKVVAERLQMETEILQGVDEERRLAAETQARLEEEERRIGQDAQRRVAEEERRLAELEEFRKQQEVEAGQRNERERRIRRDIERLSVAEAEARKRIEQSETRRRAAEEGHRLAEEKALKIESEAHLREVEEEHSVAKLETLRRSVAVEVQARAEQEKRIREEIEKLRKLEEEERHRVEEEARRRVLAETRLQQERERFKAEEAGRVKVEVQHSRLVEHYRPAPQVDQSNWRDHPGENLRRVDSPAMSETTPAIDEAIPTYTDERQPAVEEGAFAGVPSSISAALRSEDPYERVTALTELARVGTKDAFTLIADSFDDQSPEVRNAAALALHQIEPNRPVESFTKAFEEGSAERRRNLGVAIAGSGLASESINSLNGGSRDATYNALCLLFLMAKTGEVQPLVQAIEEHKDLEVRRAAIRLLTLSGQSEIADAAVKRRLNGSPAASRQ